MPSYVWRHGFAAANPQSLEGTCSPVFTRRRASATRLMSDAAVPQCRKCLHVHVSLVNSDCPPPDIAGVVSDDFRGPNLGEDSHALLNPSASPIPATAATAEVFASSGWAPATRARMPWPTC
eukprot:363075-Chlamydomonas_euryale.AAC.4